MNDDFLKEKIGFYKLWLTFLYPTDASLIVWFYNNYAKLNTVKFYFILIALTVITFVLLIINNKARNFLLKLGDI
jgi:hypothetical protein